MSGRKNLMTETIFEDFHLCSPLMNAIGRLGYKTPTPIQQKAITPMLTGRDILGCAQTGTGKTAAFALPILEHLGKIRSRPRRGSTRCLVLAPTRELALQVADSFRDYGCNMRLNIAVAYGGVGMINQIRACERGLDVLVATPGRLLDLMGRGHLDLDEVKFFVLDEADRMLDMGFLPDVGKIVDELPVRRQTAFFSATMPPKVAELADHMLFEPIKVAVKSQATPVEKISQKVLFVAKLDKRALLDELLKDREASRVLVFTRTKYGADKVAKQLAQTKVRVEAIHGNKSQNARQSALGKFRSGKARVLVATDIAARGIDVDGVTHVINYDLPNEPESYVHRIGRTGRAGAEGIAISFCDRDERGFLRDIEKLINKTVPLDTDQPFHLAMDRLPQIQPRQHKPRQRPAGQKSFKPKGKKAYGGWRKPRGDRRVAAS